MSKIQILDAIQYFIEKKQSHLNALNDYPGTYSSIRIKLLNNIDTYNKIIKKLYNKYETISN